MAKRSPKTELYTKFEAPEFFSSGCLLLDKALSGGLGENRIINIIGDPSTGKTLMAIVATKFYNAKYPDRPIDYIEAEAAFNPQFARALGLPEEAVRFPENIITVEEMEAFLLARIEDEEPGLVIVDSLDALSTEEEQEGKASGGYAGARKAADMSTLFRKLNSKLSKSKLTVIIISQTREKIGVMFGRKWTRAGGKALGFYASQVIVLAPLGKLVKTVRGIKRPIGTMTQALVDKNKFGPSYRSAEVPMLFEQGIDDYRANIMWLKKVKVEAPEGASVEDIRQLAAKEWDELEAKFRENSNIEVADDKGVSGGGGDSD